MATGAEWSCPICHEVSGSIAYVGSCLHKFCRDCIVRWARKNPSCPLCRQAVHTIIYPAPPDQGFVEMAEPQPAPSRSAGPRMEPGAAGPQSQAHVAGFPPETWALLFRNHPEILRPLELWLDEVLCGASWLDVAFAHGRTVVTLCRYGLHEEALRRELQPFLQEQTAAFVRRLIEVAEDQCSELALRHMQSAPPAAEGQQNTPVARPGDAASRGTSVAEEEPREEPGQAGAEASGAGQSGGCAPGASWQPPRRRDGDPQGSGAGHKKPCLRQN